ncbi:MAG: IS3 family transposase [Anaerolineae bacterium]
MAEEIEAATKRAKVRRTKVLRWIGIPWATFYRYLRSKPRRSRKRIKTAGDTKLIDRLKRLVESHPTYGYRKIWALCKRSGLDLSPSKVYRLLKGEGLLLPRPQEKRAKRSQVTFEKPDGLNQLWQLDITYLWIELYGFHYAITVIDYFSRYVLTTLFSESHTTQDVVRALEKAREEAIKIHGSLPETITLVTDNGPQMTSKGFLEYLRNSGHFKHVRISYRHPTSIGLIERFHRTLKEEEVWVKGYRDPIEARRSITRFIKEYNYQRPHQSLGYATPWEVYRPGAGRGGEKLPEERRLTSLVPILSHSR